MSEERNYLNAVIAAGGVETSYDKCICGVQADTDLTEKAVDCLRILTTGNERNQLALYSIPVGIRALVHIMTTSSPSSVRHLADSLCNHLKVA